MLNQIVGVDSSSVPALSRVPIHEGEAMKIHLSRWTCLDPESNLLRFEKEAVAAAAAGAEIVVFPELFLTGYTGGLAPATIRESCARISSGAPETLFVCGSISEDRYNRTIVYCGGDELAHYDKIHLFRPNREHEMWQVGDRYVAFSWRNQIIGLITCNDIRFPEQARALCLQAGCSMLISIAWWPWRRDHVLRDLMRARAIENGVWVLVCCIAGSVLPDGEFAGAGNHLFDPTGEAIRTTDDRSYEIDLDNPPPLVIDPAGEHVAIDRVELIRR
jgi:predicted amidohydrolase